MSERKALQVLLGSPISQEMVSYVVNTALKVIQCKKSKTIPSNTNKSTSIPLPSLMTFITRLIRHTNVQTGTFLTTLVYLKRITSHLPPQSQGSPCTLHRVYLACLIISCKYHNDSAPNNATWAKYTDGLFQTEDVNLMERQLLALIKWDVKVSEIQLVNCLQKKFLDPIMWDIQQKEFKRRVLVEYNAKQKVQQQVQLLSPLKPTHHRTVKSTQQLYTCPKYTVSATATDHTHQYSSFYNPNVSHSRSSSSSSISSTFSRSSSTSSFNSTLENEKETFCLEQYNYVKTELMDYGNGVMNMSYVGRNDQQISAGSEQINNIVDGSTKLLELPAYSFKF